MSHQNECVATVKEMMAEVMREKNALVGRLNAMHQEIAKEEDPVTKVRRKVEWAAEKERSIEALNKIVASLQHALDEEDISTHGSTAFSDLVSEIRPPPSCSSASFAASRVARDQADLKMIVAAYISYEAGAAEPRQQEHRAPAPLRKSGTWPLHRVPARPGGEPASTPSSSGHLTRAWSLRSLSAGASQLPQQVRRSLKMRAMRFSASFLRKVGWDPAVQENQKDWDYSV